MTIATAYQTPIARDSALSTRLFEGTLPGTLLDRLVRAVLATGDERLKKNYMTTFWFPRGQRPGNVVEEAIETLYPIADPGALCIGTEWWLGRMRPGEKLRFHFDRDLTLRKTTGEYVHPLFGSVLYLNDFYGSPTVVLDQVPGPDGDTRVPRKPTVKELVYPVANRYLVFPGNLRHGVIPDAESRDTAKASGSEGGGDVRRLSVLVNYWDRRPLPPICLDYDGTIYSRLKDTASNMASIGSVTS